MRTKDAADNTVRDIRLKTRKQYSAEEKIPAALKGLRGEEGIAAALQRDPTSHIPGIHDAGRICFIGWG